MAFTTQAYAGSPDKNIREFLCDFLSDINNLPKQGSTTGAYHNGTPVGSKAFVIEDSSLWILSNANEWVRL